MNPSRHLRSFLLLAIAPLLMGQNVAGTETILSNGPAAGRFDLVFLAEGYTATEQEQFLANVRLLSDALFAESPFLEYRPLFNVKAVLVQSAQDEVSTVVKATAFKSKVGCDPGRPQLICVDDDLVTKVVLRWAPEADAVVVLLNTDLYGGTYDWQYSLVTMGGGPEYTLVHELGHDIGGLADEYEEAYPAFPGCFGDDCPEPNVSLFKPLGALKWSAWVDPGIPLPTPEGTPGVGLFEGARYQFSGVYRPVDQCKMRTFSPFCPVCQEALVRAFWRKAHPLEDAHPSGDLTAGPTCDLTFYVRPPELPQGQLTYSWTVDGAAAGSAGPALGLKAGRLGLGAHEIRLTAQDHTPLVRNDPDSDLTPGHSWAVTIEEGAPCPTTGCSCTTVPTPAAWLGALAALSLCRRKGRYRP